MYILRGMIPFLTYGHIYVKGMHQTTHSFSCQPPSQKIEAVWPVDVSIIIPTVFVLIMVHLAGSHYSKRQVRF